MLKFNRKSYKFGEKVTSVLTVIFTVITIVGGALMTNEYCNEMLDDPAFKKVYDIEEQYIDDYTKAVHLDDVKIEKGDVIVVSFETENYEVTTKFDVYGNFLKSDYSVKCAGQAVAAYIIALIGAGIICCIIYIPFGLIKKHMEKKEDEEEKEKERLEKERLEEERRAEKERFEKELEDLKARSKENSKKVDEIKSEINEVSIEEVLTDLSGQ